MVRILERTLFWILDGGYRIIRTIFHWLLSLIYWSRGQRVPYVRDPVLQMSATELAEQIREGTVSSDILISKTIDRNSV